MTVPTPKIRPATPEDSAVVVQKQNAIAIETRDGKHIRRALLDNFLVSRDALTAENASILDEFCATCLAPSDAVIAVSCIRAFRTTGQAVPRGEDAACRVRRGEETSHRLFPIVAVVAPRQISANFEIVSLNAAERSAVVRFDSVFSVRVPIRLVLCCSCDRESAHGNFELTYTEMEATADGGTAAFALAKHLQESARHLGRFLSSPVPGVDLEQLRALAPQLQYALDALLGCPQKPPEAKRQRLAADALATPLVPEFVAPRHSLQAPAAADPSPPLAAPAVSPASVPPSGPASPEVPYLLDGPGFPFMPLEQPFDCTFGDYSPQQQ